MTVKKIDTGRITQLSYEILSHCIPIGGKLKKAGYTKRDSGYSFKFRVEPDGYYVYVTFKNKSKELVIKFGNTKNPIIQVSSGSAIVSSKFSKSEECLDRVAELYKLYFGTETKALEQFKPKKVETEEQPQKRTAEFVNIVHISDEYGVRLWRVKKDANLKLLEELLQTEVERTKLPNQKVLFDLYVQGNPSYLRMVVTAPEHFKREGYGYAFVNEGDIEPSSLCAKIVKEVTFEPKPDTDYVGVYYEAFNQQYEILKSPVKPIYIPAKYISMVKFNPVVPVDLVYVTMMLLYGKMFNDSIIDSIGKSLYSEFGFNGNLTLLTTAENPCGFIYPIYFSDRTSN